MLIRELEDILQGEVRIIQYTYFNSFQIHQLTLMYCFEHTNHDNFLNSLISKSLQTLFPCA